MPVSGIRLSVRRPVERFAIRVYQVMGGNHAYSSSSRFLPAEAFRPERVIPPEAAAGLDYPSTSVGTVGRITVEYATSLGQNGQTLARRLLGAVEPPYIEMASFFGVAGGAVTFVVAPLASRCRLTRR